MTSSAVDGRSKMVIVKNLEDGWRMEEHYTRSGNNSVDRVDRYWYSPKTNKKLRSRVELQLFKAILKDLGSENNEDIAWKRFTLRRKEMCAARKNNKSTVKSSGSVTASTGGGDICNTSKRSEHSQLPQCIATADQARSGFPNNGNVKKLCSQTVSSLSNLNENSNSQNNESQTIAGISINDSKSDTGDFCIDNVIDNVNDRRSSSSSKNSNNKNNTTIITTSTSGQSDLQKAYMHMTNNECINVPDNSETVDENTTTSPPPMHLNHNHHTTTANINNTSVNNSNNNKTLKNITKIQDQNEYTSNIGRTITNNNNHAHNKNGFMSSRNYRDAGGSHQHSVLYMHPGPVFSPPPYHHPIIPRPYYYPPIIMSPPVMNNITSRNPTPANGNLPQQEKQFQQQSYFQHAQQLQHQQQKLAQPLPQSRHFQPLQDKAQILQKQQQPQEEHAKDPSQWQQQVQESQKQTQPQPLKEAQQAQIHTQPQLQQVEALRNHTQLQSQQEVQQLHKQTQHHLERVQPLQKQSQQVQESQKQTQPKPLQQAQQAQIHTQPQLQQVEALRNHTQLQPQQEVQQIHKQTQHHLEQVQPLQNQPRPQQELMHPVQKEPELQPQQAQAMEKQQHSNDRYVSRTQFNSDINHDDIAENYDDFNDLQLAIKIAVETARKKRECENNYGNLLSTLASTSFFDCLSPAIKIILKNIEMVRLLMVSRSSDKRIGELCPGLPEGGTAIQCKFCKASKRYIIYSVQDIANYIEDLGLNHIGCCCFGLMKAKSDINKTLTEAKINQPQMGKRLKLEITIFSEHLMQNIRRKKSSSNIPMLRSRSLSPSNVNYLQSKQLRRKDKRKSNAFAVEELLPLKKIKVVTRIGYKSSKAFAVQHGRPL